MKSLPKNTLTLAGFFISLLGALLFSTKAVIVKKAFVTTGVDAVTLLALRMAFSAPFYLVAALLIKRREAEERLSARQWLTVALLGLLGYYLSSLADFVGLQYISAGLERLILFIYPTLTVLFNAWLFRQRISRNQWLALLLTYSGIGFAFLGEVRLEAGSPNFWWGSFCVFVCAVTFAIYLTGSGRVIPRVGANRFTTYAMLASTAGVLLHYLVASSRTTGSLLQPAFLPYGILLAVVATVTPSYLLAEGMKRVGSSNVAIISSIGPVSTVLQAHFVLGERIIPEQVTGTVLVVAGIVLLSRKEAKSELEV